MNITTIKNDLQTIFRHIFDDENLQIHAALTADDVSQWDSLTHIVMINAVEKHFNITISFSDLMQLESVGDLIKCIEKLQK